MRLPTWEELSSDKQQIDILESSFEQSLFVVGPPGSGKTVMAVRRAQLLMQAELGVVIVTFNRMLRRLIALLSEDLVDAQTMQSFVWNDYMNRLGGTIPPRLTRGPYAYDWATILEHIKPKGAQTSISHLIIDEGQDLPEAFFRYAHYISKTMTVFADEDQAINENRTTLEQIKRASGLGDPIILSQNHRNTPEVARLAEHFHRGRLPSATVRRSRSGDIPRLIQTPNVVLAVRRVVNWFLTRGGAIGVIVYSNVTGNEIRERLIGFLPRTRIQFYRNEEKNENKVDVLEPGVTILNKESAKGQEFDSVFIVELERFVPCTDDSERRAMYMMCTRARDDLFLVCSNGRLSERALEALPNSTILERE